MFYPWLSVLLISRGFWCAIDSPFLACRAPHACQIHTSHRSNLATAFSALHCPKRDPSPRNPFSSTSATQALSAAHNGRQWWCRARICRCRGSREPKSVRINHNAITPDWLRRVALRPFSAQAVSGPDHWQQPHQEGAHWPAGGRQEGCGPGGLAPCGEFWLP